jgi:hypothetical protein
LTGPGHFGVGAGELNGGCHLRVLQTPEVDETNTEQSVTNTEQSVTNTEQSVTNTEQITFTMTDLLLQFTWYHQKSCEIPLICPA